MLAAQRIAQDFVSASEDASLLIGETVGAPGEGDGGLECIYVSGAQVYECHSVKLTACEHRKWPPARIATVTG